MKKIMKIQSICILLIIVLSMFSNVLAVEKKTTLNIIQKESETKKLDNNQGKLNKKIINSNSETGEATIQLSLNNILEETSSEEKKYENTEIYILVSENIATKDETLNKYVTYIETFANKVFSKNNNTKIGIIGMKGTIYDGELDENGNMVFGENDQGDVKGTTDNAEIVSTPTNDINKLKNNFKNMNTAKVWYRVNLQAAIRLGINSYSKDVNKILISLYDNVPSIAIGIKNSVSGSESAVISKHEKLVSYTKSEILKLKDNNIDFILLRPEDTSFDQKWYSTSTGELKLEFDGSPYVKDLYGTMEEPTYGKMYSLTNDSLEKVVTEYIYSDIIEKIGATMKTTVIKDYFPQDIIDNFDITVTSDNLEKVDTTKLQTDRYITWNIGDLESGKSAVLEYKLKIKDMQNENLLEKTIATNEKVELTYIDYNDENKTVTLTSSPRIQLSEVKEELTATVSYDPTTSTKGNVTVTIKTNKPVKEVEGWTLAGDAMTLKKVYSSNVNETVHLVDEDGMTKDVIVKISNIITGNNDTTGNNEVEEDNTTAGGTIPQTGVSIVTISILSIVAVMSIIFLIRYKNLKDIK